MYSSTVRASPRLARANPAVGFPRKKKKKKVNKRTVKIQVLHCTVSSPTQASKPHKLEQIGPETQVNREEIGAEYLMPIAL